MLATGVFTLATMVSVTTSLQAETDDSHRGRVISLATCVFYIGVPVGALLGGVAAQLTGLRETMVVSGAALAILFVAGFRSLDRFRPFDGRDLVDDARSGPSPVVAETIAPYQS
jgi:predicted MFS family arabinose efflux permease